MTRKQLEAIYQDWAERCFVEGTHWYSERKRIAAEKRHFKAAVLDGVRKAQKAEEPGR